MKFDTTATSIGYLVQLLNEIDSMRAGFPSMM